jgi:hypothetical protein
MKIVKLCESPPTANPQEAGLRACFAAYQRQQNEFPTDEAAWTFYSSSRQRFYEWNPQVKEFASDVAMADLVATSEVETSIKLVDGDIHATGTVYAQHFVTTGAFSLSAPPSPPASQTASQTPSEFECISTENELAQKEHIRALQEKVFQYEKQQVLLTNQIKVMAAYNAHPQGNEVHERMRRLQAAVRRRLARKFLVKALRAATCLQATLCGHFKLEAFATKRQSAIRLQSAHRRDVASSRYESNRRAIHLIQTRYRLVTAQRAEMPHSQVRSLAPACSMATLLAIIKAKDDHIAAIIKAKDDHIAALEREKANLRFNLHLRDKKIDELKQTCEAAARAKTTLKKAVSAVKAHQPQPLKQSSFFTQHNNFDNQHNNDKWKLQQAMIQACQRAPGLGQAYEALLVVAIEVIAK